ncbi:MAG: carbohydrate transporter permease [Paenibacillaceae bacterium]|jgi:putative aldouronate transport system permease protein|nr:carbohydrate transporter permease [Paenibacillaceae bacterium]
MAIKESWGDRLFHGLNTLFLLLLVAVVLYPLIFIVSGSFSDPAYVNSGQMWLLPKGVTLEGYKLVFGNPDIWTGYRNSLLYTAGGVMINLSVTITCAYALSRKDLAGRNAFMFFILFTMFFSGGLIPSYLLVKSLGLVNSYWALVLPSAASVMNIVVSRTFFQSTIPRELEEAAEMDGCSNFRLFFQIVLPLSKPILAVMALFYGVGHWNQYFSALIYLSDRGKYPLQLFLREILVQQEMSEQMLPAGADLELMSEKARVAELVKYAVMMIAALPLLCAYPFVQRFFVQGVMIGSIKQ